jgi:hypothetical protein
MVEIEASGSSVILSVDFAENTHRKTDGMERIRMDFVCRLLRNHILDRLE